VPAESKRFQRRIGARDRWFLGLLACALLIGALGAVILRDDGSRARAGARCVKTIRPGFMGGATYTYCGKDAAAFCRRSAAGDEGLAAQCERLGLIARRPQATTKG
jgi:hypothetical protein